MDKLIEFVDPELVAGLSLFPDLDLVAADLPLLRSKDRERLEAISYRTDLPVDLERVELRHPDSGVQIYLETYRPRGQPRCMPAILHIHGGGYVLGSPVSSRNKHLELAAELGCFIASVEYRLAPEAPFPAAVEDCYLALIWLASEAGRLGVDGDRIAIAGESAGAGLAAAVALLARDRGQAAPIFQCLIYPMLDDRTCVRCERHQHVGQLVWTERHNMFGWSALLGVPPGSDGVSQYAAASRAKDLRGLPPAFIVVGALDLFLDENIDYARRLIHAGVSTELHIYPGAYHGFMLVPGAKLALAADGASRNALKRAFAITRPA